MRMKAWIEFRFLRSIALLASLFAGSQLLAQTQYVITNDDVAFPVPSGVSFFSIGANGLPVLQQQVTLPDTYGVGGGYFGMDRLAVLDSAGQQCVYASQAWFGSIQGISVSTLTVASSTYGSATDAGTANGIGLAINPSYLYASYSNSNTIGTFAVEQGCGLVFIGDTSVAGLLGGIINGMALHGNMLIVTYTDGSIESFNVSGGTPVSNGDEQISTATLTSSDATYPNSIDITGDGHFAIFGDTSTSLSVEISDISSGKLSKTSVFTDNASISSSNAMLSPDESVLYVINTQGASVSALFFNAGSGKLSYGCTSRPLAGLSADWSYLGGVAPINQSGNGGGVYVGEFGAVSGIGIVTLQLTGQQKCSLQEAVGSPVIDPNSPSLLSIGTFPPRSF
jgi:hypothetical protein